MTTIDTQHIIDRETAHASGATGRRPVVIVRGKGARLWDSEGKSYIDCAAGHGWANVGHCHPEVTRAIADQAATLVAHTESSYNDQRALWFEELSGILAQELGASDKGVLSRIHPCNSGTEAVEGAIKLARALTGRPGVVAMKDGFHGRTLGALSATWNVKYRAPFEPLVPGFRHVPYNNLEAANEAVGADTAAVIVEIIQGEGGVNVGDPAYLRALRALCDRCGSLLIVDEIQTGLGRTGRWFACAHTTDLNTTPAAIHADIIALGKSLGGGIPMGALVWREALGTFASGTHGSTFGGNPLACAAGRAVLRMLRDEQLPARAEQLGRWLRESLQGLAAPVVREVRGHGLMVGIELRCKVTPILKELMDRGVWALPAGLTVLRLLPPLTIAESDLQSAVEIVGEVLHAAGRR